VDESTSDSISKEQQNKTIILRRSQHTFPNSQSAKMQPFKSQEDSQKQKNWTFSFVSVSQSSTRIYRIIHTRHTEQNNRSDNMSVEDMQPKQTRYTDSIILKDVKRLSINRNNRLSNNGTL